MIGRLRTILDECIRRPRIGAIGRTVLTISALLAAVSPAVAQPTATADVGVREVRTPFYLIRTDLTELETREIAVRMSAMAQEYAARTAHFGRRVPAGMTFAVFRHPDDYEAAGGQPGSAGLFNPETGVLMAVFGAEATRQTWHTIQHEGFHQFTHAAIGDRLPPWLNEGLAEYFGEAVFTGDGFVTGIIRPERLERLRERLDAGQLTPFAVFMQMNHEQWNGALDAAHYDQAWGLAQFLITAENGRYLPLFERFILLCNGGTDWPTAWRGTFGPVDELEAAWIAWVRGLEADPTHPLRQAATLRTLTSFWARAEAVGQRIDSAAMLLELGETASLSYPESQWLPASLLTSAVAEMRQWEQEGAVLEIRPVPPDRRNRRRGEERRELLLTLEDGTALSGRFETKRERVTDVELLIRPAAGP